jgi:hypothetical protein
MNQEQAKEALVEALASDMANTLESDLRFRCDIARKGHKGFESLTPVQLIAAAQEADLDDSLNHGEKVREAIAVLSGIRWPA